MYFINFVTYRREKTPEGRDQMVAYRIQRAHGYEHVAVTPFAPLFAWHTNWIAQEIAEYNRRNRVKQAA
jgi:hypothetical protein